jgi:hypothetical protein
MVGFYPFLPLTFSAPRPARCDHTPSGGRLIKMLAVTISFAGKDHSDAVLRAKASPRVELDYELFVYRRIDDFAAGQREDFDDFLLIVPLQPIGTASVRRVLEEQCEERRFLASLGDVDHVARFDEVGRNVDRVRLFPIGALHEEMAVRHELTRLRATSREIGTAYNIVETTFQKLQERLTGLPGNPRGVAEVILELRLDDAVVATHLLLLAKLTTILADLGASRLSLRFLARGRTASFDGAFFGKAAIALEEKLDFFAGFARRGFATAEAANRACIA